MFIFLNLFLQCCAVSAVINLLGLLGPFGPCFCKILFSCCRYVLSPGLSTRSCNSKDPWTTPISACYNTEQKNKMISSALARVTKMQRGRQSAQKSILTQHEHPCVTAGFLLQGCKLLCQSVWSWGGIPSGRSLAVVVSAGFKSPAKRFPLGCGIQHGELKLVLSHSSIIDLALEEQMSSRSKTRALPPGMDLAYTSYIHTKKTQPNNMILLWESMNVWISQEDFWSHQPRLSSFEKRAGISRQSAHYLLGCACLGGGCAGRHGAACCMPLHAYLPETGPGTRGNMLEETRCRQTSWCPRPWKNFSWSFCFYSQGQDIDHRKACIVALTPTILQLSYPTSKDAQPACFASRV